MLFLQAWRSWQRARSVALLAAAALAVGIGSTTAIYSVVNAVMLKPLPYRDGDRFVALFGAAFNDPEHFSSLSFKDARTYHQRTQAFDAFGWFRAAGKNLMFAGEPLHIQGVAVTLELALRLGVEPALGRWFHDQTGVMMSSALWRRLGSDRDIVGKPLTLDGRGYTVAGVLPEAFRLPVPGFPSAGFRADVWIALDPLGRGEAGDYFVYARRRPGVTLAAADADVKRVAAEIAAEEPATHPSYTARLFDLRETVVKDIRPTLLLLFAAAALLFLITCANAAGLLLARSVARARETAVRVALGASRAQLAAHYFVEGLLVALAGAGGGIFLSVTLTPAIVAMAADYLPRADEIAVDWTVLLFALAAAFVASGLSSLAPLWQAVRTTPADALGEGVRASAGARSRRLSQSLVVAEIALAFALLAAGTVLVLHLRNLSRVPPGFDADRVLTFVLSLPGGIARDPNKRIPHQKRLIESIRAIPGVDDVAYANQLPLNGCCMGTAIYPEGRPIDPNASQRTSLMATSSDYARAMRIPLWSGRLLADSDAREDLPALPIVIDQSAARRYWGDQDPVGAYGRFVTPSGSRFQVVGVVGDVRNDGLSNPTVPEIYLPGLLVDVETMNFVVRSERPPASLVADIRRVVRGIDPEQPIHEITTMRDIVRQSMALERVGSFMTTFFAGAALLMATLGIYGVVSYSVRQRTVEIGTRMALGATSRGVLALVVGGGLKMAAYGVIAGGVAAVAAVVYLGHVFKIAEVGSIPFVSSTAIVAAVTLAASAVPAWRAAALSPVAAIRNEPESLWQAAAQKVRGVVRELTADAEAPPVPLGALITEFALSVRSAASFPEALQVALATLRERAGAQSIMLLEKASNGQYRCANCALPAEGFLVKRLVHYPHPLTLTTADFEVWLRWAREFSPEHTTEIEGLRNTGARVAVPLRTKNDIVGVLLLGPPDGRESYTPAEKQMLSSAADVFALMVENARLTDRALAAEKLRRDVALAAEVQRRLLPAEPPRCDVATLAAFSLSARTVGGDYYDFLELSSGRLGIAIADVTGKGIPAALLMSVVQASLRVIAADGDIAPSQLADRMNRLLYRSTDANKYATFFYATLEDRGRRLRYVNAGHNPPCLVRRTDTDIAVVELTAGGTVLGLFPEAAYDEAFVDVSPGDLLVAFTDGVPEALNPEGEEFGEERLKQLLREAAGCSAPEISTRVADRMRDWIAGAEQHDDLTVVVVALNPAVRTVSTFG